MRVILVQAPWAAPPHPLFGREGGGGGALELYLIKILAKARPLGDLLGMLLRPLPGLLKL